MSQSLKFLLTPHIIHTYLLICFYCLFLISCGAEEEISRYNSNISGLLEYQGKTFSMQGGLLDEKADSLFSRRTFQFKISPKPIEPMASTNEFAMYVSSDEPINLEIKLTSDNGNDIIKPGTYSFSESEPSDVDFPQGLVAHYGYVFIATRTATTSTTQPYPIRSGEVTVSGDFPDYTLTFSLSTDTGVLTGSVSGEFITRASWKSVFFL